MDTIIRLVDVNCGPVTCYSAAFCPLLIITSCFPTCRFQLQHRRLWGRRGGGQEVAGWLRDHALHRRVSHDVPAAVRPAWRRRRVPYTTWEPTSWGKCIWWWWWRWCWQLSKRSSVHIFIHSISDVLCREGVELHPGLGNMTKVSYHGTRGHFYDHDVQFS